MTFPDRWSWSRPQSERDHTPGNEVEGSGSRRWGGSLDVLPVDTIDHVSNVRDTYAKLFRQLGKSPALFSKTSHTTNLRFCQNSSVYVFAANVFLWMCISPVPDSGRQQSKFFCVTNVVSSRQVFKVAWNVVRLDGILVIDLHSRRSWPQKRFGNELMYEERSTFSTVVRIQRDAPIANLGHALRYDPASQALADSPERRGFVPAPKAWSPAFFLHGETSSNRPICFLGPLLMASRLAQACCQ